MQFPDKPTCHEGGLFVTSPVVWRPVEISTPPELAKPPFRTCSYCGSIHPEDLLHYLTRENPPDLGECLRCWAERTPEPQIDDPDNDQMGLDLWTRWSSARYTDHTCRATLGGSDWKYGWPHKFYVMGIPNPIAGESTVRGYRNWIDDAGIRHREEILSKEPPTVQGKWYNTHLVDEGYDDEALNALVQALSLHSGIVFDLKPDGKLSYKAPYYGYQR